MKTKLLILAAALTATFFSAVVFAAVPNKSYEIGVTKGAYAIESESYEEARGYLQKALDANPSGPEAQLLMGIAYSRDEKYSKARGYLVDALRNNPASWRTKFELAVVYYHLDVWEDAKGLFNEVIDSEADRNSKSVAQKYLSRMSEGADYRGKPYTIDMYVGVQFDDNVILEPESPDLFSTEDNSDWKWFTVLDANLALFATNMFKAETGYMFYHSFHDKLEEYDVEQHNVSLDATFNPNGRFTAKAGYEFSYSRAGGQDYNNFHIAKGLLSLKHSEMFQTEVHYAHEFQDYEFHLGNNWMTTMQSYINSLRTGDNDAAGITGKILFNKQHLLTLDYTYNVKEVDGIPGVTDEEYWGYEGHKATVRWTSRFDKWQFFLSGAYTNKQYEDDYWLRWSWSDPYIYREDRVFEYSVVLMWNPVQWLTLSLTENYLVNDSNVEEADYKRNIIGFVMGVAI